MGVSKSSRRQDSWQIMGYPGHAHESASLLEGKATIPPTLAMRHATDTTAPMANEDDLMGASFRSLGAWHCAYHPTTVPLEERYFPDNDSRPARDEPKSMAMSRD